MRDSLARHIVRDPASPEELFRMRQRVWQERGLPMLPPAEIADEWECQVVVNIAERMYGKRRGKAA